MPRNLFVIELKKSDEVVPVVPVVQERASVPVVTPAQAPSRAKEPTGRPWPGGGDRKDLRGQRGQGGDVRRRRSAASRFRG